MACIPVQNPEMPRTSSSCTSASSDLRHCLFSIKGTLAPTAMQAPLFIHIGTHKTGTTAIQRAFKADEKALLKEGLVRLRSCDRIALPSLQTAELAEMTTLLRQEAERRSARPVRYLMTCEGFSGDPLTGYADAPVIASRLRAATQGFDVRIILFLRRQDDFIESLYTQRIHEGRSETFEEFLRLIRLEEMSWLRLTEAYAAEFGRENLIVRRYHKAFYPEPADLLADFCKIVGVRQELIARSLGRVRNQGFSREAVELARSCNPHLDKERQKQLRQLLQPLSAKPVHSRYAYFTEQQREQLLALHQAANDEVARRYLSDGGNGPLFPPDIPGQEGPGFQTPGSDQAPSLQLTLVTMLLEMKAAEKRSGLLRFVMRMERWFHAICHPPKKTGDSIQPPT